MKSKFLTIAVVVLALFSVFNFFDSKNRDDQIRQTIEANPSKTIVYNGKDGKDGKNGIDGINAVSFSVTQLTIKEVPLVGEVGPAGPQGAQGPSGQDGKDAPFQQIRVNSDTLNIENKLSSSKFWTVLVHCADYRLVCP